MKKKWHKTYSMLSKMIMSLLKNNFFLYHIIPVIIISQCNYSNFVNGLFDLLLHWLGNKGGEKPLWPG